MATTENNDWLKAGINAIKSGDKEKGRVLLMKIIETDEKNELAWLWLAAVVESDEEKRICFENVLTVNPDNRIARKQLTKLNEKLSSATDNLSPLIQDNRAGDIAIEDSFDEVSATEIDKPTFSSSIIDDVWANDDDICAYCATVLGEDDLKCPKCKRQLIRKRYRYPATAILHVFWVFLLTLGLVLLFQAGYKLRVENNTIAAAIHVSLTAVLIILVFGVYFRMIIAHITSIIVLILVSILSVANFLIPFDPSSLGTANLDPAFQGFTNMFVQRLGIFLKVVQISLSISTLFYAIFRASPEFDQVKERVIAKTKKGLNTAVDYHMNARRYMHDGMWASAVLHWQRAAAIDPHNIIYQRDLAKAYFRLGFIERGLIVLQSALELPMQPVTKAEVDKLIIWAELKLAK